MTELNWPPIPVDDRVNGRNSNIYLAAIGHPTEQEKKAFLEKAKSVVIPIANHYKLPASAIIAMLCIESGFGFTRTAAIANNYLGMKSYRKDEPRWQLVGQPQEDAGQPVLEKLGNDRIIFDESKRTDNWYQDFESLSDCVIDFVANWILGDKYKRGYNIVCSNYQKNRANGMKKWEASFTFLRELANRGYCHLGGDAYVSKMKPIIDKESLYLLDYDLEDKTKTNNIVRILIDPGHSERAPGASGLNPAIKEHEMNIYQAKILKNELEILGIQADIVESEWDDKFEIGAKAKGYDAFISLHLNAYSKKEHYTCAMVHPKFQMPASNSSILASRWAAAIAQATGNKLFEGGSATINGQTAVYPRGVMPMSVAVLNAACSSGCPISFLSEAEFIDDEREIEPLKARLVIAMKAGAKALAVWFAPRISANKIA